MRADVAMEACADAHEGARDSTPNLNIFQKLGVGFLQVHPIVSANRQNNRREIVSAERWHLVVALCVCVCVCVCVCMRACEYIRPCVVHTSV